MKKTTLKLIAWALCFTILISYPTIPVSSKPKTLSMQNIYKTQYRLNSVQRRLWNEVLRLYEKGIQKKVFLKISISLSDLVAMAYNPHLLPKCYYADALSYLPGISFAPTVIGVDMKEISKVINTSKSNEIKLKRIITSLNLTKQTSEKDAILKINNYLCQNVKYDFSLKNSTLSTALSGKTTCKGYALVFTALCKTIGINSSVVYGFLKSDNRWVRHAWNKVTINNEIKYIDVCSNALTDFTRFLLLSESELEIHKIKNKWFKMRFIKLQYF